GDSSEGDCSECRRTVSGWPIIESVILSATPRPEQTVAVVKPQHVAKGLRKIYPLKRFRDCGLCGSCRKSMRSAEFRLRRQERDSVERQCYRAVRTRRIADSSERTQLGCHPNWRRRPA